MAPKKMPKLLVITTALVVVAVLAVATSANVFKTMLLYEKDFVKIVGPYNKTFTAKLHIKGGEAKRVEIKLSPNGSAVILDGGRPWVVIKQIKMVGGEVKRVELKLLPNDTLLVINGREILSIKIEKKAGTKPTNAATTEEKPSPELIKTSRPISGTLPPYSGDGYGPYTGLINMEFNVSWSPSGYLCVGYVDLNAGSGPGICGYGQSLSASFSLNPSQNVQAVVININSYSVDYSGILMLYYQ